MENSTIPVWFHTSAASPYRRHLFERFAEVYPRSRFFFTLHDGDPWLKYQAWHVSSKTWKIDKVNLRLRIPVPRVSFIHLDYIWYLLFQPRGTIHMVGCVHGNGWLILLSCLLRKSYYIAWSDGGFSDQLPSKRPSLFKRFALKHITAGYSAGKIGFEFDKKFGIPPSKIFNAYFSHDIVEFKTFYANKRESERVRIRKLLNVIDEEFIVLCVARLMECKRLEDLAEAMFDIDSTREEVAKKMHFVLIGDGDFIAYKAIVVKLKHVKFHYFPRIEYSEIKGWFCASDVFGFPSEGDIWGLVVNEALSLGLPVICTDRIGASELVKDGWNGFITKVRAPEQIGAAILKMVDNPNLVEEMRKNAITIWDTWNSEKGIQEFEKIVELIKCAKRICQ